MKKETLILITLACVNFTHIMDSMIMMPLGGTFMDSFGIGPKQFTMLVSSYAIGAFLSNIAGIFLLDMFDRKRAMLVIYGGFVIGTFSCALCHSYESLLMTRFITGLFGGLNGALVYSIVSDVFSYSKRGRAMGALMAGFSAAAALGVPFGLLVSMKLTWNYAFYFIALFGVPIYLTILFGFPPLIKHMQDRTDGQKFKLSPIQTLSNIIKDKNQMNALAFGVILVFGHMFILPFIAPFMERNVGFSMEDLIYMYLIGGVLTVFSSPMFGRITDRFGGLRTYYVLLFLSFIPTVWITNLNTSSVMIALTGTSILFVFGSGRMIAPQAMISAAVSPQTRGSFMSFKASLQQLGIGLASILSGLIVVETEAGTFQHYDVVGYIAIAVLLTTLFVAGKLKVAEGN
ncbi:MAG: MFS transporter [Bacteroidetes bacterium]|nr:MFS transporter [Bacteroidota bacterium]